jgi:uncharacterized protein
LETAGIETLQDLSMLNHAIRGLPEDTQNRLKIQAELQQARKTGEPSYQLREPIPGKGFELLPQPQKGDLFYDIEGDPHFEGGLEYLHGIWFEGQFKALWAHDHKGRGAGTRKPFGAIREQISNYPDCTRLSLRSLRNHRTQAPYH